MRRSSDPILLGLLAASLFCNAYQYRHIRLPLTSSAPALKVGDTLPPFSAHDLRGAQVTLRFEQRPTILYIFSPKCSWCDRNFDNAIELSKQTESRYNFVAVSLDDTTLIEYIQRNHLRWTVLTNVSSSTMTSYRLGVTPQTIVVGPNGVVLHSWTGAYSPPTVSEIQKTLAVRLPGLSESHQNTDRDGSAALHTQLR
jgi:peroxiredoxin